MFLFTEIDSKLLSLFKSIFNLHQLDLQTTFQELFVPFKEIVTLNCLPEIDKSDSDTSS